MSFGVTVLARTGEDAAGKPRFGSFIVPKDTEGFTMGPKLRGIGWKGLDTRDLSFDEVWVPDGQVVGETIEEQTHKTIDNIEAVLRAEDASLSDVIKVNVHLIDTNLFPRYNKAYQERFTPPYPARTTVGSDLHQVPGMMIEIEAIAYVGE